ncbi:uncharacterized protein K02A2.6-like [Morus notabilis]|uniref:uncharacterized protein K02A2.6-like n=1 Tax=Morus notabilis TaxID=981085 RepID=UPI000CED0BEE|nr:uncharacterized protein K02A2.6-like [Morus notabilis]
MGWRDLRTAILHRFSRSGEGDPTERLMALRQSGTVAEFRDSFEALAAPMRGIPESVFKGAFLNGLREDIRAEVKLHRLINLQEVMDLAQQIEARDDAVERMKKLRLGRGNKGEYLGQPSSGWLNPSSSLGPAENPLRSNTYREGATAAKARTWSSPSSQHAPSGDSKFRRLSEEEVQQRRAKGLCFRCDERFSPGHRCKNWQLQVLLVVEDGTEEDEESSEEDDSTPVQGGGVTTEAAAVSLNSMRGLVSSKTMKLRGFLGSREVIVLIDSGACHSFISLSLVDELAIPTEKTPNHEIQVGNGRTFRQQGRCRNVRLEIQGHELVENFFPFELGSADVILGVTWLGTLGEVRANWSEFTMKFKKGRDWVHWKGDPALCVTPVSFRSLTRSFHSTGVGLLLELQSSLAEELTAEEEPLELRAVLAHFEAVFGVSTRLPPQRAHDHRIVLKDQTALPNIRPYRYPQIQKAEVEKLIDEMLAAGIVRPSCSPYSSPVLLVRKKDGSWRFCVDYRALNQVTIPDRFPIPLIDELMDELHGAKIFSKLDLQAGYHQIRVRDCDVEKTAFRTHEGHYEFLVMPFGLTNAPATFQALMNSVFRPYLRRFVLVFFYDILIYSKSWEEHQDHLSAVLEVLEREQLFANRKKCAFGRPSLEYLGHIISEEGVAADPSKIQAISTWPPPRTIRELRGFLGLAGYYRRFVVGFGELARPLTTLLKRVPLNGRRRKTRRLPH